MNITFCGGARTVTGSCYLVECSGYRFLIDCGMFQGSDENLYERGAFPFEPSRIDFVILTHAHIDHSGRLPLLVKRGFKGKIYSTDATKKLSLIMLLDSAHIQKMEAEWGYKKHKRGSGKEYNALYDIIDVENTMKLFSSFEYNKMKAVNDNISFRFQDAGHLLGSCHVEVFLKEDSKEKKIVFSGDIGNTNQPLIKNPTFIRDADFVVTESTYGDKLHQEEGSKILSTIERAENLAAVIDETFKRKGNLIIPAFAVGRTQEILYFLHLIHIKRMLDYQVPVFLDSPMGIKASDVFASSIAQYFDNEAKAALQRGENILQFPSLLVSESVDDSKKINSFPDPCVIISSSGMCNAGRIKHHLKYNLWRENSSILFTGYQATGTLGRMIIDGAHSVRIFGEPIDVKAHIYSMKNLSGHADQSGIIKWISAFDKARLKQVFVVHGEERSANFFSGFITKNLELNAYAPKFGEKFNLLAGDYISTEYKPIEDSQEKIRLDNSVATLKEQEKLLNELIAKIEKLSSLQDEHEKKKINKFINKVSYISADIEELYNKWYSSF